MSNCLKATSEELAKCVRPFCSRSFVLDCKHCRDIGSVSANRRTISSEEHKFKAAEKFVSQGWRIEDGIPVCPACFTRRFGKGKYAYEETVANGGQ